MLAAQGARWEPTLKRVPFHRRATLTHTHSDWDQLDVPMKPACTCLGRGRKLESLVKTHADMGRMCKLHRPWLGIDFSPHFNSYNKMMLEGNDVVRGPAL